MLLFYHLQGEAAGPVKISEGFVSCQILQVWRSFQRHNLFILPHAYHMPIGKNRSTYQGSNTNQDLEIHEEDLTGCHQSKDTDLGLSVSLIAFMLEMYNFLHCEKTSPQFTKLTDKKTDKLFFCQWNIASWVFHAKKKKLLVHIWGFNP